MSEPGTSPRARGRRCKSRQGAADCFKGLLGGLEARCYRPSAPRLHMNVIGTSFSRATLVNASNSWNRSSPLGSWKQSQSEAASARYSAVCSNAPTGKQRPHQETRWQQVVTSEPVVHHHGREEDGAGGDEVRPSVFNGLLPRLVSFCSTFPGRRLLLGVHDRDDVEDTGQELIEDHIREALHELASKSAVDDWSFLWIVLKAARASASASGLRTIRITGCRVTSWRERIPRSYQPGPRDPDGRVGGRAQPVVRR